MRRCRSRGYANPEVLISISDATATEGVDETADFVVTLNRKSSGTVTVEYTHALHRIGNTRGGLHNTEAGTLTFRPGETSKIISVPIIDDTVNDSGETFALLLYDAKGADIADEYWNRHHPQHGDTDRQLRERAGRARRQHTVHLRRRL